MASPLEEIKIALKVTDANASSVVKKLESSFRGLASASKQLDTQGISKVRDRIKSFDTAGRRNIETIRGQVNALQALRGQAEIGSRQFKQLTADVNKYSQELAKAEGRSGRGGIKGRLKSAGGVAATALGAGVFGGPEGFLGAVGGGIIGGVPGAVLGATGGAFVSNIRKQAGAIAETVATYNKYQIALAGVSKDQEDFNASIEAAKKFSDQFVVPLDQTISQYTKLKASVVGAGLGTKETNKAFEAISASILATGGNAEDVNSALRATAQVFSKGKVSAEELRQQIGERLPGAFTVFADSMGISTKQLDKLLEQGKVTLDDFVGFTEELIRRFGTTAEELAKAPELAGARLQVALKKAEITFGGFFASVGAGFQDYITGLLNLAVENEDQLKKMMADFILFGQDLVNFFKEMGKVIGAVFGPIFDAVGAGLKFLRREFKELDAEGKFYREEKGTPQQFAQAKAQIRDQVNKEFGVTVFNPLAQMGLVSGSVGGTTPEARQRYTELFDKRFGVGEHDESYKARRQEVLDMFKFDTSKLKLGSGLRSGDSPDGSQDDSSAVSKRLPASQRMVELTEQLAQRTGELGERELITLKYMIARQNVLDNNLLKATDKEVGLNKALEQFRRRILALDEKEASAKDAALAKLTKFEQLEANVLAKKMGLTGEQTKQQLLQATINSLTDRYKEAMVEAGIPVDEVTRRIADLAQATVDLKDKSKGFNEQFAEGIKSMGDLTTNLAGAAVNAFTSMSDKLHEFVTTGKANFTDFANSLLSDLSRIFIRFAMFQAVKGLFPGISSFLMSANGNAFAKNGIVPFAKGGIVNRPTLFQYANGGSGRFGLMGEAGPEAIMPLRRGANGRLGVEASGASAGHVTVNVDASGSSVQGDAGGSAALGKAIGAAVQQELVKQKRPGGLLAS